MKMTWLTPGGRAAGLGLILTLAVMTAFAQQSPALAGEWDRTPVWATATALALAEQNATAIILLAPGAPSTAWTVVEWQDARGQWQTVAGWQGGLDADGHKTWRVAPASFGTGPFRWVVYVKPGGAVWAVSAAFQLPASAGLEALITAQPASAQKSGWTVRTAGAAHPGVVLSLAAAAAPAGAWTAVQWQDGRGDWHTVAGWQGALESGQKSWWAAADQLSSGPYRWVIYTRSGGAVWAVSPAFMLPAQERTDVIVELQGTP